MLLLLAILIALVYFIYSFRYKNTNLPPSPVAFPVIGHLHLLRDPIHRVLRDLSRKHGPVYFLRLGSRRALVVSSLSAAEECLTNQNDIVFANRPFNTISDLLMYNYTMVGAAPYGDHWRNLRRICSLEIFSTARLNASADIRRDEVRSLLQTLHEASSGSSVKVELRPMLMGLTFNVIMRMVAGKLDYGDEIDVKEEAREFAELAGVAEIGDFLPIFKVFDFSGHVKRAKRLASKMDEFLEKLVDQHRRNRGMAELENTMINHLLSLQESQPQYYTNEIIKGLVLVCSLSCDSA